MSSHMQSEEPPHAEAVPPSGMDIDVHEGAGMPEMTTAAESSKAPEEVSVVDEANRGHSNGELDMEDEHATTHTSECTTSPAPGAADVHQEEEQGPEPAYGQDQECGKEQNQEHGQGEASAMAPAGIEAQQQDAAGDQAPKEFRQKQPERHEEEEQDGQQEEQEHREETPEEQKEDEPEERLDGELEEKPEVPQEKQGCQDDTRRELEEKQEEQEEQQEEQRQDEQQEGQYTEKREEEQDDNQERGMEEEEGHIQHDENGTKQFEEEEKQDERQEEVQEKEQDMQVDEHEEEMNQGRRDVQENHKEIEQEPDVVEDGKFLEDQEQRSQKDEQSEQVEKPEEQEGNMDEHDRHKEQEQAAAAQVLAPADKEPEQAEEPGLVAQTSVLPEATLLAAAGVAAGTSIDGDLKEQTSMATRDAGMQEDDALAGQQEGVQPPEEAGEQRGKDVDMQDEPQHETRQEALEPVTMPAAASTTEAQPETWGQLHQPEQQAVASVALAAEAATEGAQVGAEATPLAQAALGEAVDAPMRAPVTDMPVSAKGVEAEAAEEERNPEAPPSASAGADGVGHLQAPSQPEATTHEDTVPARQPTPEESAEPMHGAAAENAEAVEEDRIEEEPRAAEDGIEESQEQGGGKNTEGSRQDEVTASKPAPDGDGSKAVATEAGAEAVAGGGPAFVHLLAAAADGAHDPQVFRMRRDQPLRRLVNTYAVFRGLNAEAREGLRMSTPTHSCLDPAATANSYALADGDWVTFARVAAATPAATGAGMAAAQQKPEEPRSGAEQERKVAGPVGDSNACPPPQQPKQQQRAREPRQPRQPRAPQQLQPQEDGRQVQPKRPPSAYWLWMCANRGALAAEAGSGKAPAVSRVAGERWKVLAAEERALYETQAAEAKAAYEKAFAEFVAQGGIVRKRARRDDEAGPALKRRREAPPKKPWGGAYAVFLAEKRSEIRTDLPADAPFGAVSKAAGERWKALPEDEKKAYEAIYADRLQEYKNKLEEYRRNHAGDPELSQTQTRLMRSAAVTSGPAKGWKVMTWKNKRGTIQWQIVEPGRGGRTFRNFKELKGAVEDAVHAQLHTAVRPGLLRRISERQPALETPGRKRVPEREAEETPYKARRPSPCREPPQQRGAPQKQPRPQLTPLHAPPPQVPVPRVQRSSVVGQANADLEWSCMATQCFRPVADVPKGKAWACGCQAHLTRHTRCVPSSGQLQPQLIHLRDYVTVGRGETCDVVLGSSRTPQMLSRCHAAFQREGAAFAIVDQGSMNGVLVNGENVRGRHLLNAGDVVTLGVETQLPEFDYVFELRA